MIAREEVQVGSSFDYPHPDGVGIVRTTVVRILRPTDNYPSGRVQHEAYRIGRGSIDTMEVFCASAVSTKESL